MTILALETSCDDTAAAVIRDGRAIANVVSSQLDHRAYGGVVPELASRAHQRYVVPVVRAALETADVEVDALDAVAATYGPGLAGSLLVGLSFGKAFAASRDIPFLGVNHLEGHLYSPFAAEAAPPFPFLALVVSGGHTDLVHVTSWRERRRLGQTRDDAAGEAFDKVAKLLGLGYPGGPALEALARSGDAAFHRFPLASLDGYDYSFSGIKTSVLYHLNQMTEVVRAEYLRDHGNDLAASFESAMVQMILAPLKRAIHDTGSTIVSLSGGVTANKRLRAKAESLCSELGVELHTAPAGLRTDNAAMIGMVAYHQLRSGRKSALSTTINPSADLIDSAAR